MNLKIYRERRFSYAARKITVCLDGCPVTALWCGREDIIDVPDGDHVLSFCIGGKTLAAASLFSSDEQAVIACWTGNAGGIDFYSSTPNVQKQYGGEKSSSFASGFLIAILCVILIAFIFFLLNPFVTLFLVF